MLETMTDVTQGAAFQASSAPFRQARDETLLPSQAEITQKIASFQLADARNKLRWTDSRLAATSVNDDVRSLARSLTQPLRFARRHATARLFPSDRHSEYVGDHLGTLAVDALKVFDLVGDIVQDAQQELHEQIKRCFQEASLPDDLITQYYMIGKRRRSAKPTILIWNGDAHSRKRAKALLKRKVLTEEFDDWAVVSSQHNPALPALAPTAKDSRLRDVSNVTIWRNDHFKTVSIESGVTNRSGVAAGAVRIDDKDYLVTAAHTITGHSPLDGLSARGLLIELDVDSDNDEYAYLCYDSDDEDDDESDNESKIIEPVSLTESSLFSEGPPIQSSHTPLYTMQEAQDEMLQAKKIFSPRSTLEVYQDSAKLDCALVRLSSAAPASSVDPYFLDSDWSQEEYPTDSEVYIRTSMRGVLTGRFSSTAMSFGTTSAQEYWVWNPDAGAERSAEANHIQAGDSGAWVFRDRTIHGMVIAGDMTNGRAIVVPAACLVQHMTTALGDSPQLWTKAMTNEKPQRSYEACRAKISNMIASDRAPLGSYLSKQSFILAALASLGTDMRTKYRPRSTIKAMDSTVRSEASSISSIDDRNHTPPESCPAGSEHGKLSVTLPLLDTRSESLSPIIERTVSHGELPSWPAPVSSKSSMWEHVRLVNDFDLTLAPDLSTQSLLQLEPSENLAAASAQAMTGSQVTPSLPKVRPRYSYQPKPKPRCPPRLIIPGTGRNIRDSHSADRYSPSPRPMSPGTGRNIRNFHSADHYSPSPRPRTRHWEHDQVSSAPARRRPMSSPIRPGGRLGRPPWKLRPVPQLDASPSKSARAWYERPSVRDLVIRQSLSREPRPVDPGTLPSLATYRWHRQTHTEAEEVVSTPLQVCIRPTNHQTHRISINHGGALSWTHDRTGKSVLMQQLSPHHADSGSICSHSCVQAVGTAHDRPVTRWFVVLRTQAPHTLRVSIAIPNPSGTTIFHHENETAKHLPTLSVRTLGRCRVMAVCATSRDQPTQWPDGWEETARPPQKDQSGASLVVNSPYRTDTEPTCHRTIAQAGGMFTWADNAVLNAPYAALSHRWGSLTVEDAHSKASRMLSLPATKTASYLWIDALCISQEPDLEAQWLRRWQYRHLVPDMAPTFAAGLGHTSAARFDLDDGDSRPLNTTALQHAVSGSRWNLINLIIANSVCTRRESVVDGELDQRNLLIPLSLWAAYGRSYRNIWDKMGNSEEIRVRALDSPESLTLPSFWCRSRPLLEDQADEYRLAESNSARYQVWLPPIRHLRNSCPPELVDHLERLHRLELEVRLERLASRLRLSFMILSVRPWHDRSHSSNDLLRRLLRTSTDIDLLQRALQGDSRGHRRPGDP